MKIPPYPEDEAERLEALHSTCLLDTVPEPAFDRITEMSARIFSMPIALVSLVDETRQWFKSRYGLDATETPRSVSFCGHAILHDEPLIVPDANKDARFLDNPLVTGPPHLAFYAGAPLIMRSGARIGTLCLIDTEPRPALDAGQSKTLQQIAETVVSEIELRRVLDQQQQQSSAVERTNDGLRAFTRMASHDLREPLRAITSYTQILKDGFAEQLGENGLRFTNYIHDGGLRLSTLLEELLRFTTVSAADLQAVVVDTGETLQRALAHLDGPIRESGAEITCGELPTVRGDAATLGTVLQNLVSNAVKYRGDDAPRIEVSAEREGAFARICVRDNGIGIDAKHQEKVFESFKRLHGRSKIPGTGLGLAICRTIVERHGGRIWVESDPGRGSAFYFTIPAC